MISHSTPPARPTRTSTESREPRTRSVQSGVAVAWRLTASTSSRLHGVTTIGFSTDTDVREDRRTVPTDEGDHERFSHYVDKHKLTEATVMGTPVVALCGKVWVPSRAPEKFPVCPECKEIWEGLYDGPSGSDE